MLGVLPLVSIITGEIASEAQFAGRKPKEKKQMQCAAARIDGHPDYVDTTFGPMPAEAAGCALFQVHPELFGGPLTQS
jgi:hypothetical protein